MCVCMCAIHACMCIRALYINTQGLQFQVSHQYVLLLLHRWFTHFYVWAVTWDLLVFVHLVLVLLLRKPGGLPFVGHILHALTSLRVTPPQGRTALQCTQTEWEVLVGMFLLLLQASRRLYECLFVMDMSKQAKMHLIHYLVGYLFYTLGAPTMVLHWKQGGRKIEFLLWCV